jgi:hypothetical protein
MRQSINYNGVNWYTTGGGTQVNNITWTSAMQIANSGGVSIGNTTDPGASNLSVTGYMYAGNPVGLASSGVLVQSNGFILQNTFGTNFSSFYYYGTNVGSITTNGINVAYNTSSDRRLKTSISSITTEQSGAIIDALQPRSFTWINSGKSDVGFVADELASILPNAVTGEANAVDAEGKPVYQQIDASMPEMIAYLVAEIQSLRARLKTANIA